MSRALLWFTFRTRIGVRWRVLLSTPAIHAYLRTAECEGYTDPVRHEIVLDVRYPWARVAHETAPHEIMHAAIAERELEPEDDERTVTITSAPAWAVAVALGARTPRAPSGLRAFRRAAIALDGAIA